MGPLKRGLGRPAISHWLGAGGDLLQSAFGFLPVPLQTLQVGGRAIFCPHLTGLISTNWPVPKQASQRSSMVPWVFISVVLSDEAQNRGPDRREQLAGFANNAPLFALLTSSYL